MSGCLKIMRSKTKSTMTEKDLSPIRKERGLETSR